MLVTPYDHTEYETWTGEDKSTEIIEEMLQSMEKVLSNYDKSSKTIDNAMYEYACEFVPDDIYIDSSTISKYAQAAIDDNEYTGKIIDDAFRAGWRKLLWEKVEDNQMTLLFNILATRFNSMPPYYRDEIELIAKERGAYGPYVVDDFIRDTVDEDIDRIGDFLKSFDARIEQYAQPTVKR